MDALLPPSSRIVRPKRECTISDTRRPISVEPVKDSSVRRLSLIRRSPTVRPGPVTMVRTPGGTPLRSSTLPISLVRAAVTRQVEEAPFQMLVLPQMSDSAMFQPHTATGKLNAVITPTLPSGFQHSRREWVARSLGITWPLMQRLRPTARSQMSMNSCTSPMPSARILPISSETSSPRGSTYLRSSSPIWRTISPRLGAGISPHARCALSMVARQRS
mmetsp:Transcript_10278/g.24590  ORF Transcript_10278/g.24590 Transcript_10278/m.24590 type:complete len:218 (-) Transcript_10278:358-1011(-)